MIELEEFFFDVMTQGFEFEVDLTVLQLPSEAKCCFNVNLKQFIKCIYLISKRKYILSLSRFYFALI